MTCAAPFDFAAFNAEWRQRNAAHDDRMRARWLYCQGEGEGEPVKIGVTANLAARHSAVQGHTWREVVLFWAVPGNFVHEAAIKHLVRGQNIRGEWYLDGDDAIKSLTTHNRFANCGTVRTGSGAALQGGDFSLVEAMIERLAQETAPEVTQ